MRLNHLILLSFSILLASCAPQIMENTRELTAEDLVGRWFARVNCSDLTRTEAVLEISIDNGELDVKYDVDLYMMITDDSKGVPMSVIEDVSLDAVYNSDDARLTLSSKPSDPNLLRDLKIVGDIFNDGNIFRIVQYGKDSEPCIQVFYKR